MSVFSDNRLAAWAQLKRDVISGKASIHDVNDFWNKTIAYKTDLAQFGTKDYWQTPIETLINGYGDCEDIAIGKLFTLVGTHDVYLCYCKVQLEHRKEGHMTCVVKKKFFLFSREINLDIQSRPILNPMKFKINAVGIDKLTDLLKKMKKEEQLNVAN